MSLFKVSRKKAGMNLLETGLHLKSGNVFGVLSAGKKALDDIVNIGNEGKAQAITEQTRYAFRNHVRRLLCTGMG